MEMFGKKKEMLSNKEQKVYDYLVNTGESQIPLRTLTDVFGNSANGILGRLKRQGLIEITKNFRGISYGRRAPKVIKLVWTKAEEQK